jgi:hypothetical protein
MLHTLVSSHSELRDKKTRTVQNVSPSVFLYQVRACSKQIQVPQTFLQVSHPLLPPVPLLWHSYISTGTHSEKKGTEEYHVGKTMTTPSSPRRIYTSPGCIHPAGWYCGSARSGTYPKCPIMFIHRETSITHLKRPLTGARLCCFATWILLLRPPLLNSKKDIV